MGGMFWFTAVVGLNRLATPMQCAAAEIRGNFTALILIDESTKIIL